MIPIILEAITNCMVEMWTWLTVAEIFQGVADSVEIGHAYPYCGKRRGRFEYCQGCGAQ